MAKEKLVVIKDTDLSSNCPECFNQSLKLTFYQKHRYGTFMHKITDEVTHKINCNTCKSDIYPVKWTDDIERLFGYYQKMVTTAKKSIKFTPLFYGLIVFLVLLAGVVTYLYTTGIIEF